MQNLGGELSALWGIGKYRMVIRASGIARGRVRTTTTTVAESRKMAAILQIVG